MTKLLLSAIFIVFSFSALACKPSGLPTCEKLNFRVDQKHFDELYELVKSYQGILTKKIKRPQTGASSCFNNNFAVFYAKALQEKLKENKGKTCLAQVERVKETIHKLIDRKSKEFLTITNTSDKKHLKREAKKVKIALQALP